MDRLSGKFIYLFFLFISIFPDIVIGYDHAHAMIGTNFKQINLGKYLDVLIDNENLWTIEDVSSPEFANKFKSNTQDSLIIGPPAQKIVWVRFILKADNYGIPVPEHLYLELGRPRYRVDFFQPSHDDPGQFQRESINRKDQPAMGDVNFRHLTFRVDTHDQSVMIYYVRLEVFGPEFLFFILRSDKTFHNHTRFDYLIFGLLYGVLLGMVVYNLFIFVILRDNLYFHYVLYISSFLLYLIVFMGHIGSFMELKISTMLIFESIFLGGTIFFGAVFCRNFFSTNLKTPFWNKVLYFLQLISCGLIITGLLESHTLTDIFANFSGIAGPITFLSIGMIRWRQGFKPAGFFIIANLFFIFGTMIFILWGAGVLFPNLPGELIFTMGPVLESVLLSFSLAYRIRILEGERLALTRSRDIYKYASQTDGLTSLYNKQYLFDRLTKEIEQTDPAEKPLSLVMMDVDNFKNYNDTFGHPEGDVVLKELAGVITSRIRDFDYGCRYGGEEFTIVLPNTGIDDAFQVAERIRKDFSSKKFQPGKGEHVSVTVSIGATSYHRGEYPDALIKRADKALYIAKRKGKNMTRIAY